MSELKKAMTLTAIGTAITALIARFRHRNDQPKPADDAARIPSRSTASTPAAPAAAPASVSNAAADDAAPAAAPASVSNAAADDAAPATDQ